MRTLLFLVLFALSGLALATGNQYNESGPGPIQDHTCQGGNNCNTHGTETGTPQTSTNTFSVTSPLVTNVNSQDQHQGQAQAQDQSQGQSQVASSVSIADASNRNYNESSNTNLNVAEGGEGGTAYQGQSQNSSNDNSNSGNAQSINIEAAKYRKNTPSAYAPAIYSSSACTGGGLSGSAVAPGFGLSLGGSKQDPQCQVRENARILSGLDTDLAIMYLCANPLVDVGAVLGTACKPAESLPPIPEEPEPKDPPVVVIQDQVKG